MNAIINLNTTARAIVMDVFRGNNLDTKNASIRANIGNLIRKEIIFKTETGGYALTKEAQDFITSITTVSKDEKKPEVKEGDVHKGFLLMRGRRIPSDEWFTTANEVADKIEVHCSVRTRGLYCGNFLLIIERNKNIHSFEVREKGLRIIAKNEDVAKKLAKIGLEARASTNGAVYYCDGSLKLVDKAIKILEKSL